MNFTLFAAIGAIAATIASFWSQIRGFFQSVISLVIKTDSIETSVYAENTIHKILSLSKIIRFGNRKIGAHALCYLPSMRGSVWVYGLLENKIICLYKNFWPVIILYSDSYINITYLYGTVPVATIFSDCLKEGMKPLELKSQQTFFYVEEKMGEDYTTPNVGGGSNASNDSERPSSKSVSPMNREGFFSLRTLQNYSVLYGGITYNDVKFSHDIDDKNEDKFFCWTEEARLFAQELEFWKNSRQWYRDRSILHRRGILLHGAPGNGKSYIIVECAKRLSLPVIKINIANMSDREFKYSVEGCSSPMSVVVIEDIDSVFNGRKNMLADSCHTKQLLSFEVLLNTLSSPNVENSIFFVLTANNIKMLDYALIRDGRMDRIIEVHNIDEKSKRTIASNILRDYPDEIEPLVKKSQNFSFAEFENLCKIRAVDLYNKSFCK